MTRLTLELFSITMVPEVDLDPEYDPEMEESELGSDDSQDMSMEDGEPEDHNTDSVELPDSLVVITVLNKDHLVVGCMDNNIYIAAVDSTSRLSLVKVLEGHTDTVTDFAVNGNLSQFASASYDGTIIIWSSISFEKVDTIDGPSTGIDRLVWDYKTNRLMAACEDGTVWFWDYSDGYVNTANVGAGHTLEVTSLAIKNNCLVSSSLDGQVIIWDILSGEMKHKIRASHNDEIRSMAVHPQLGTCAVGTDTGKVTIVSTEAARTVGQTHDQESSVECVAFDASGSFLCSGSTGGCLIIRDVSRLLKAPRHEIKIEDEAISTITWHNGNDVIVFVGTSTGKITAYSPFTGECLSTLSSGGSSILSMVCLIGNDGHSTIVTGSDDGVLRSFDIELTTVA